MTVKCSMCGVETDEYLHTETGRSYCVVCLTKGLLDNMSFLVGGIVLKALFKFIGKIPKEDLNRSSKNDQKTSSNR
jgi:hypothetical protein